MTQSESMGTLIRGPDYMVFATRTANNNQYPICNHTLPSVATSLATFVAQMMIALQSEGTILTLVYHVYDNTVGGCCGSGGITALQAISSTPYLRQPERFI